MGRVIEAFAQFFDGNGDPLVRGWLRFLSPGTNNTDKTTYFDSTFQIPNENPLQLDGEGRCPDVFGQGDYRVISFVNDPDDEDSPGEQIQVFDPVTAQLSQTVTGSAGSFVQWDPGETYELFNIVTYNAEYYRSLISSNIANYPNIEEYAWEKIEFMRFWNSTITYTQGDLVFFEYNLYLSKQSLNVNNEPDTSPDWWRPVATGYHNIYVKTGSYEILPGEYDSVFVLSSAATADAAFDLPAMDATTDRFRVAIYNESSYDLTVSGLGGVPVWIDTSGDIILEPGVFQEFIYSYDLDTWLLFNNSGQALGGQILGTVTTPVSVAHITTTDISTATITTLNATTIHIPDDQSIYFGDGDDCSIRFVSASSNFYFFNTVGGGFNFAIGANTYWNITSTGIFSPGASNPNPDIGTSSSRLDLAYLENIYVSDAGRINLGTGNDLRIYHPGDLARIYCYTGAINISTLTAASINLVTNSSTAIVVNSSQNSIFYGYIQTNSAADGLYIGSSNHLYNDGSDSYWDNTVGSTIIRTGAGPTATIELFDNQVVGFYGSTLLGTDEIHVMGDALNSSIGYTAANGLSLGTSGAQPITFFTNSTNRWIIDANGNILPTTNDTYQIGWAFAWLSELWSDTVYLNWLYAPSDLEIWVQGGAQTSLYYEYPVGNYVWWYWINRLKILNIITNEVPSLHIEVEVNGDIYIIYADPKNVNFPPKP